MRAVDGPIRPISHRVLRFPISKSLANELLFGRQSRPRDVFHSAFHILGRTRPPYFRTLRSSFTHDSERLTIGTSRLPRFWADHFQGHSTRKITCLSMSDARRSRQPYAMRAKSCYESKPDQARLPTWIKCRALNTNLTIRYAQFR